PTSSKEATRPFIFIVPVVGRVTLDNSFNNVDFPAPLRPITPNTSPFFISKLMSFNAHTYSEVAAAFVRSLTSPTLAKGSSLPLTFAHHRLRSWLIVPVFLTPSRYCFERFCT